jgi:hypothetical protein
VGCISCSFEQVGGVTADRNGAAMDVHPAVMEALVRRCEDGQIGAFLAQGDGCGWCRHPVRLRGHQNSVDTATGARSVVFSSAAAPDGVVLKGCGNRRQSRCPTCAAIYRADARHLVRAGLEGGKGADASVATHPAVLVTLTAPGFGPVHRARTGGPCTPGARRRCCHGRPLSCFARHTDTDEVVGTPLCFDCYDYEGQVLHNALTPELWRRMSIYVPRHLARVLGVTQAELKRQLRVSYVRVAEFQRRGAIHLHVVVRLDTADGNYPDVEVQDLQQACLSAAQAVSARHGRGTTAFGTEVDVQLLDRENSRAGRVAAYVAKYATKSSDDSGGLDQRIRSADELDHRKLGAHPKRLAATAWALGSDPDLASLHPRRHAHCFGYGGHFLSKSRGYSTTLGALRAARAAWRMAQRPRHESDGPHVSYESRWRAVGVGWANYGERLLAEQSRDALAYERRLIREEEANATYAA